MDKSADLKNVFLYSDGELVVAAAKDGLSFYWNCPDCKCWNLNRRVQCEECGRALTPEQITGFVETSHQALNKLDQHSRSSLFWKSTRQWVLFFIVAATSLLVVEALRDGAIVLALFVPAYVTFVCCLWRKFRELR